MCNIEKRTLCRPITFYNDYMPVFGEGSKAEFSAFGIVDGVQVGDILLNDDNAGESITDCIWKSQKQFNNEHEDSNSAHRIYIVRYDTEKEERIFWEGDIWPFFFFCRIQFDKDKIFFMKDRSYLENYQCPEMKIRTYLTYDNTDLFVVIRTSKYVTGVEMINRFHQNRNFVRYGHECILKNSFSVMAVRNEWISYVAENEKEKWNTEKIDRVYIRLIERKEGDIDHIFNAIEISLKRSLNRWPVLGTDDEMIVLSEIGWGDFLSLYEKKTGIFGDRYSENSIYKNNAAGVTTQICVKLPNGDKATDKNMAACSCGQDSQREKNESHLNLFKARLNGLQKKLIKLKEQDNNYISELNIILGAMPKYSGEMFNDYIFFPLLKILDKLLDLMIEKKIVRKQQMDKEGFHEFLTGFCFYAQNTMLTDKHTAQILGFNVKIYDVPVKLNAFYNAYLYRITDVLNIQKRNSISTHVDYDFFALPGMEDKVTVEELYSGCSDTKRLMKASIPEYCFYDVRFMMIVLAHEAAHYVGREFRRREKRTEMFIASYVHIFIKHIEKFGGLCEFDESEWKECEGRLIYIIYDCLCREVDEQFFMGNRMDKKQSFIYEIADSDGGEYEYFDTFSKRRTKNINYFEELVSDLQIIMKENVIENLEVIFAPLLLKESSEKTNIFERIRKVSWRFVIHSNEYTIVASIPVLNSLRALYAESFADLMSVLILRMSAEEYIKGIIESAEYQNMDLETLLNTDAMVRIAAVLVCICKDEKRDLGYKWKQELNQTKVNSKWGRVAQSALFIYMKDENEKKQKYEDNVYCAMKYDTLVLEHTVEYLQFCMEAFDNHYQNHVSDLDKVNDLRELFQIFAPNGSVSGEEQIIEIVRFIEKYKTDLQEEMRRKTNDESYTMG